MTSSVPPERLLDLFKKDLENLKENDKYKINALTIFARDHKDDDSVASGIVELTVLRVHAVPSGLKLLSLYVIDSIVKNVAVPFRKLYSGLVVDAFVHSFQAIRDEKGRLKLYNLRTTWKDIFPNTRMYELDIRVREHDPAWPVLATPPENKAAFRSLPNIPKIQPKTDTIVETSVSSGKNTESTVSSRDPRLNRKRPSPTANPSNEEFLIDRSGDQKMEAVARKQGKKEDNLDTKKITLFGGHDLDMRSQATTTTINKQGVWTNYLDKNADICPRRDMRDVDMRIISTAPDVAVPVGSIATPKTLESISEVTVSPASNFVSVNPPTTLPVNERSTLLKTPNVIPLSIPSDVQWLSTPQQSNGIPLSQMPPVHLLTRPNFEKIGSDAPKIISQNRPATCGPPIRGPVWNVEILGFPDMVNIGVDPRMLSLATHPKPPRRITIDGRQYSLLLDRVQPLIMVGDQVHAIRFRCEFATVLIDGRCFTIPGTGFTKVMIGWRPHQAYLGGPGHELVIDGRPHTIPMGSQLTYITVGNNSVGVKFVGDTPRNVNVLPAIPPRLLKWAAQGLFGSPRNLHLAPLNPLTQLSRLAEGRPCIQNTVSAQLPTESRIDVKTLPTIPSCNSMVASQQSVSPVQTFAPTGAVASETSQAICEIPKSIDVHALFQKLVKAGIVSETNLAPPSIDNYNWERFKQRCPSEVADLYCGYQCSQCGIRFESDKSPEFDAHLDYHYMKNSNEDQGRRSRNFYHASRYWLLSESMFEPNSQLDAENSVPDLQESKCPAFAEPSKNVCGVCFEKFEVFWDHDEEEWMLRDAVLCDGNVYHPICQEDAGKEFGVQNSVAHEMQEVLPPSIESIPPTSEEAPVLPKAEPVHASDEPAFVCEEKREASQIPGLSPLAKSPEVNATKPEPGSPTPVSVSVKSEHVDVLPVQQDISADPLAALKAILHGGGHSSLMKSPATP